MTSPEAAPCRESAGVTADDVRHVLRARRLGCDVHAFGSCESTNLFSRRLLESAPPGGAPAPPHGAVVVADFQTAGRGRAGRRWQAPPGSALMFSVILRPRGENPPALAGVDDLEPDLPAARLTMGASLAVARVLAQSGADGCAIKWPNDVVDARGRKIAGILTERAGTAGLCRGWIVGIGVNVNQEARDFPPELAARAASLRILTGCRALRAVLLARILEELERCLELNPDTLAEAWQRRSSTVGRTVRVRLAHGEMTGFALGVEPDGRLILRTESGLTESLVSGDVMELRVTERNARNA